jgi:lipopolysaccharide/colanic/teichoic acid biosynthesis glycosyltransferase
MPDRPFNDRMTAGDDSAGMHQFLGGETGGATVALTASAVAMPAAAAVLPARTDLGASLPNAVFAACKRGFDVVASLIGLAIFGLMLPALALIIKLDSPGSVFYHQERVGINRRRRRVGNGAGDRRKVVQPGRPFVIHKLRTMCSNAEADGPQWAKQGDARITRVGRFLRKTRLDELPQLWNVLRGDMSIIGPRPERICFIRQLENDVPFYHDRLLVKPGLTGLAQVRNGYDDSLDSVRRKVEFDREYIRRCGPLTEAGILLETVRVVLKGEGAR